MLGKMGTKTGVMLSVVCVMALAVAFMLIFAGRVDPAKNIAVDNSSTDSTEYVINGESDSTMSLAGGSSSVSNKVYSYTADSGYELGYWTRTKDSVTAKFSTDETITQSGSETYAPVFVQTSTVVEVSTLSALQTAMTNNSNIRLKCNITATSGFSPVASYSGILDGAGYKITVTVSSSNAIVGGLCQTLTGVIKNLVLTGSVTGTGSSTTQAVGGIAGCVNGGLISHCNNHAVVKSSAGIAGGIVASATNTTTRGSTINACENYGSITGAKVGVIIFTNGTDSAPLANLVNNKNVGAIHKI